MLRAQAMALAVAAAAAALAVAGCDRPSVSPPASVGIRSETVVAKVAEQPADDSIEKSSAPGQLGDLMDKSADTSDKSADTSANVVASVRDDAAISAKVSSALAADLSLKSADIKVDTKDGLVTLSGNVDTPSLRLHAKEVAARQHGVAGVVDKMAVASHG
jgi:hyperosmotically inducible protein